METSNPTRHVLIALMLTALVLVIAGDKWTMNVDKLTAITPITSKPK